MTEPTDELAVEIPEIASILRISTETAYRKAVDVSVKEPGPGQIPGFKIGNRWKFFPSEVHKHLTKPVDPWAYLPASRAKQKHRLTA